MVTLFDPVNNCIFDSDHVIGIKFKNAHFLLTGVGSLEPATMFSSFLCFENDIRSKYWDVKEGDVVLDVGCAYGSYSFPAMAVGAYVIAVDPDIFSHFDFETNLLLNSFQDSCLHFKCMLGKKDVCEPYYPLSHSNRPEGEIVENRENSTVDKVMQVSKVSKLDWMKVDVEGMELDVLEGAVDTLKKYKPKLLIETHDSFKPGIKEVVCEYLRRFNYELDTTMVNLVVGK